MRCHCGLFNTVTRMMSVDGEVDKIAAEVPKRREDAFLVSAGDQDRRELADLARDQLQSSVRTKQAYPGVGVFFLATGGKVAAVIAIERSDIMVGVGTVENGALAVRQ
jgi:tRNA/tmRNA/rRNA uracil-C5-methylase (TrmA/RlmC/RlmD family)